MLLRLVALLVALLVSTSAYADVCREGEKFGIRFDTSQLPGTWIKIQPRTGNEDEANQPKSTGYYHVCGYGSRTTNLLIFLKVLPRKPQFGLPSKILRTDLIPGEQRGFADLHQVTYQDTTRLFEQDWQSGLGLPGRAAIYGAWGEGQMYHTHLSGRAIAVGEQYIYSFQIVRNGPFPTGGVPIALTPQTSPLVRSELRTLLESLSKAVSPSPPQAAANRPPAL